MYVYIHIITYIHTYIHAYIHTDWQGWLQPMHAYIHIYIHVCACVCACVCMLYLLYYTCVLIPDWQGGLQPADDPARSGARKRLYWTLQRLGRLHRTFFFLRKKLFTAVLLHALLHALPLQMLCLEPAIKYVRIIILYIINNITLYSICIIFLQVLCLTPGIMLY